MKDYELVDKIVAYCKLNKIKKIYICGNGASGKTTLGNLLLREFSKNLVTNIISTDDFLVDTELRNNAIATWNDQGIIKKGRYTSSFENSYFKKSIEEIIYNLDHGNDYYLFKKHYKEDKQIKLLKSNYDILIIEGIAAAFLDINKNNSLGIFIKCDKSTEIQRRIKRKGNSLEQSKKKILSLYDERNSQFVANVESNIFKFDMVIKSDERFNFSIIKERRSKNERNNL